LRRPEVVHPVIVAGDMNARPGSRPMQLLLGEAPVDGTASPLRDAFRLAGSMGEGKPTFHAFTGRGRGRIDYILVEAPFRVMEYEVLDQQVNGRWPSDHFPVLARVER
jgi:endonuclease/exonuclease/phosphatase family metal-dependent hydrolase